MRLHSEHPRRERRRPAPAALALWPRKTGDTVMAGLRGQLAPRESRPAKHVTRAAASGGKLRFAAAQTIHRPTDGSPFRRQRRRTCGPVKSRTEQRHVSIVVGER